MLPVTTQSTPLGYQPGLDGLRGVFVIAVLCFHGGFSWATGGYLGVSGFFTLSGFLICSLLIDERVQNGRIDLLRFWKRRARRLLPAAWLALAGALVYGIAAGSPVVQRDLPGDVVAALAYVANWRFVFTDSSYEALFAEPSPVTHLWSLAIEEQYYVVFPLFVAGLLMLAGGRRWALAVGLATLVAASTLWMAVVYQSGGDTTRAYYGTDTRAAELLIGAGAALVWQRWLSGHTGRPPRRLAEATLQMGGAVALGAIVYVWTQVPVSSPGLYRGGFALHALAVVLVLFAVSRPGPIRRVAGFEPLRRLGLISYGVYLFHWPIFLWLNASRTGLDGWTLFALRCAVTLAVSVVSYVVVERPIRTGVRLRGRVALVAAPATVVALFAGVLAVPSEPPTMMQSASFGSEIDPFSELELDAERQSRLADEAETDEELDTVRVPRVALFGDSTAIGPYYGLLHVDTTTGEVLVVPGSTVLGCGLVRTAVMRSFGSEYPLSDLCASWPERWSSVLDEHEPHIAVVLFAPWDASDRMLEGTNEWIALGDPRYDEHAANEIRLALEVLTDHVDLVVWLTSPPIDQSMNQLGNAPDPASDPERLIRWNELVAAEIARYPDTEATMVDLRGWFEALPGGPLDPQIRPDGVHITDEQAPVVGQWLAGEILDAWYERAEAVADLDDADATAEPQGGRALSGFRTGERR
ncbi:MAG: acyltransferase family protein [Acidimicrobiales bacterium]|nr:acyltransferase family protein [Acidimicrobiales bacterium]